MHPDMRHAVRMEDETEEQTHSNLRRRWTPEEDILIKTTSPEDSAAKTGRTLVAVKQRMSVLRVADKVRAQPTGLPVPNTRDAVYCGIVADQDAVQLLAARIEPAYRISSWKWGDLGKPDYIPVAAQIVLAIESLLRVEPGKCHSSGGLDVARDQHGTAHLFINPKLASSGAIHIAAPGEAQAAQ
jgi:hypothetical protein